MIGKPVKTSKCCNNRCKFHLQAMFAARAEGHKECEYPLNMFYEQKPISPRQLWAPTQRCSSHEICLQEPRVRVPNPLAQKQASRGTCLLNRASAKCLSPRYFCPACAVLKLLGRILRLCHWFLSPAMGLATAQTTSTTTTSTTTKL